MPLVTPTGFKPVPLPAGLLSGSEADTRDTAILDLAPDADIEGVRNELDQSNLIRIRFDSFADGRGFSLAKRLRNAGYKGHLRAVGHIISDQFRYALDCGFDDVEITDDLAARQPEADWLANQPVARSYRDKLRGESPVPKPAAQAAEDVYQSQANVFEQRVTHVEHFTDGLFSFRLTRPASFRFRSGEFAMIGLPNAARPVFRAYSLASPAWDDELEFYSIKVPGGPLTQHLQHVSVGDTVLLKKKATGTLVLDALQPGRRLFLFSTGTGIAPFASLIRDPETYDKFDQVILTQTCRTSAESRYGAKLIAAAAGDPIVGDDVSAGRLRVVTSLTREDHPLQGRITNLIGNDDLFRSLGMPALNPDTDRAMVCGSVNMLTDMRALLEQSGFEEGSNARPNTYVVERAFVD